MMMMLLFPLMMILIGVVNLLILRNKQDRLSVFSKVEPIKDVSFVSQISNKKKMNRSTNLFEQLFMHLYGVYFLLLGNVNSSQRLKNITFCLIGICIGIFLNNHYLHLASYIAIPASAVIVIIILFIRARMVLKKDFEANFPEAISLLVGVVSSGNSLAQGITECGIKIGGVVGDVFFDISRRLEIGEDADRVLLDSYKRLPFRDYYFFVLALVVNLQGGGEVKEIMYRLSKMITSTKALERTRDGKTAELRMTVKILSILPFAFIFLLQFISKENFAFLFEDPTGLYVLYYVIGSVVIGQLIIRGMISKIV